MNWKRRTIIVGIIAILCGIVFAYYATEKWEGEAIEKEEKRVENAYIRVNVAFGMMSISGNERRVLIERGKVFGMARTRTEQFFDFSRIEDRWISNKFDLDPSVYLSLRFYENRTGIYLSYEKVMNYFSQEFESDGSLRLYNNGNHPEIEAFVDWFWEHLADFDEFENRMRSIYSEYLTTHELWEEFGMLICLSPQMLDALARAEADPGYVLDLTGLHEQGY